MVSYGAIQAPPPPSSAAPNMRPKQYTSATPLLPSPPPQPSAVNQACNRAISSITNVARLRPPYSLVTTLPPAAQTSLFGALLATPLLLSIGVIFEKIMFTDVAALPLVLFTFITAARTATSLVIYAISAVTAYVKQWKKTKRSAKNPTPNASSNFSPDPPNAHVSPKLPTLLLITLPGLASDILYYGSLPGESNNLEPP